MGCTAETNDMLLEYNNLNQLTTVTKGDEIVTYDYYANGMRKSKSVDGVISTYYWDGQNMVGEVFVDSLYTYLWGHRLIASPAGENTLYYHFNGHGDVTTITDMYGITNDYQYDAFGNVKNPYDLDYQPFRYCGEYYDVETGFIYLKNRYYDPSIGRFISEDPIRDGLNWYVYCGNNPVMFVDPMGLVPKPLRASVEASGGKVTYNGNGCATVSVNGYDDIVFSVNDGYTTLGDDGKMYVDDLHLDNFLYAPTQKKARQYYDNITDDFGKFILRTWFFGNGENVNASSERWSDFMKDNPYFKERLSWLVPQAIENNSFYFTDKSNLNLTGGYGGYSSGYELINGANIDAGGCVIIGTIVPDRSAYQVNVEFVFNDIIDPNDNYRDDIFLSRGANVLGVGGTDYTLSIRGSFDFTYIYGGEIY